MSTRFVRSFLQLGMCWLAIGLGGCAPHVDGGEGGEGGETEDSGAASATRALADGGIDAVAISATDFANVTGINAGNPDRILLQMSDVALSCAVPQSSDACTDHTNWTVSIDIPTARLVAGTSMTMEDANAGFFSINPDGASCGGEGGTLWGGSVTIDAVDADTVSFTLSGTSAAYVFDDVHLEGSYVAPRCGF